MKNLLRNKNFRLLWFSQIMSQITINVMNFLVIVRVYESTHSPIASSLIWVAYALPAILVGPIGAATVDLVDRRKVLVISALLQSAVIAIYVFTYDVSFLLSYVVVFLYSLFNQFYVPAESASLPYLVEKKDLTEANSTFFLSQQVSLILAFVIAGVASETLGTGTVFFIASLLLLLASSASYRLPSMQVSHVHFVGPLTKKISNFFVQISDGFKFILKTKSILLPFIFLLSMWTFMSILTVNLPLIGETIVGVRPNTAGIVIVLPAAAGALTGTWFLSKYDQKIPKRKIVRSALLILGSVFILVPLLVPLLSFWVSRTVVIFAFYLAGLGYIGTLVPSLTYIQQTTPKDKMGRVLGYFWFVSSVIGILPVVFSATITEFFGISTLLIVFGIVALATRFIMEYLIPKQYIKSI